MKHFLSAGLVGLVAMFTLPAVACPDAPARPAGWSVDVFDSQDPGPRSMLFNSQPQNSFAVRAGPIQFGSLPNARSQASLPQMVLQGTFRACTAGRYEFQLILEAAPNDFGRGLLCVGEMREGQSTIFTINNEGSLWLTEEGKFATRTGSTTLPVGLHPLRLRITCGTQAFGRSRGTSTVAPDITLWQSGFALRVKSPGESEYRDFRADELFQR